MTSRSRGARGSNQYRSRGGTGACRSDHRAHKETESAAWAFHDNPGEVTFPDDANAGDCIRFAVHPDAEQRAVAAAHPKCPPDVMIDLAHDPDPAVQKNLARRSDLPAEARAPLVATATRNGDEDLMCLLFVQDPTAEECRALLGPVHVWKEMQSTTKSFGKLAFNALRAPSLPVEYITEFARSGGLQGPVARHHNTPGEILTSLSSGSHASVVAKNPSTPEATLVRMTQETIVWWSSSRSGEMNWRSIMLADNPSLPYPTVAVLALRLHWSLAARRYAASPDIPIDAQQVLADGPRKLRAVLANNPAVDPDILDRIARRGQPPWLLAVCAASPAASQSTLTRLAGHGHRIVRTAAREALSARGVTTASATG